MEVVLKSFGLFFNLAFLFSLVLIFFALLGREFFKGYFTDKFQTFATSFISVFQIITLDNWYNYLSDAPLQISQMTYLSGYIMALIFVGNYLFLNLFLTIIIDTFQSKQEQQSVEVEELQHHKKMDTKSLKKLKTTTNNEKRRKAIPMKTPKIELEITSAIKSLQVKGTTTGHFFSFNEEKSEEWDDEEPSSQSLHSDELSESNIIPDSQEKIKMLEKFVNRLENSELKKTEDYALFFIGNENWVRVRIINIVESCCFKTIIRILVWLHMILKGIDTMYMDRNYFYSNQLYEAFSINLELAIFTVFFFEVILKIIAYGLIFGPHTFLQSYFNTFNLILVLCYFLGRNATEENFITYVSLCFIIIFILLNFRDSK